MAKSGAVILGIEYQALGLLRQLSGQRIPCVLVDQDSWGPARFSRHSARVRRCPPYESDAFWPWLVNLQQEEKLDGWLLITTDDEQVRQLALNINDVKQRFRYYGPDWSSYEKLYDKRLNYLWCVENGIAAPRSFVPMHRNDLPGDLAYPFIIKPAFKRNFKKCTKAKAVCVHSEAELRGLLNGLFANLDVTELLYQEIIPGGGSQQWSYAGLFVRGEPVAAFTACRQRQHPPEFGRASTYVLAEHDPEVERESRAVLAALNYTGLAEVEWKRDPRNGKLCFLEVNARCWGWHSLAAHVVGNIPLMLYRCAHDDSVAPVTARYGARWVKHITDIPVVCDMMWHRTLSPFEYLRTFRPNLMCCEWQWTDPLPMFLQVVLIPYFVIKRGY
jgi:predicted ATP-grasp superfamily ATP-dependent carboligase